MNAAKTLKLRKHPKLRLVSSTLETPRRLISWSVNSYITIGIEHWTEAEWEQLHPAERPEGASLLPGSPHETDYKAR